MAEKTVKYLENDFNDEHDNLIYQLHVNRIKDYKNKI